MAQSGKGEKIGWLSNSSKNKANLFRGKKKYWIWKFRCKIRSKDEEKINYIVICISVRCNIRSKDEEKNKIRL